MVEMRHYGHKDRTEIRETLLDVHDDTPEFEGDAFHERERFAWFVDHWSSNPGFTAVIAYDGDEPVGFAYGAPQTPGNEWWRTHLAEPPEDHRTYAVSEVLVRPHWRKGGVSEQLHQALLGERDEPLAVLYVDVTHPKVQALYESWGYKKVGEHRPFADSPVYAVMLLALREHSAHSTR